MNGRGTPELDAFEGDQREFTTPQRSAIIYTIRLLEEKRKLGGRFSHISNTDIHELFEVAPRTARRWVKQSHDLEYEDIQAERRVGKYRPGRHPILNDELLDCVEDYLHQRGYKARIMPWDKLAEWLELPVKGDTLRKHMHDRGYEKFRARKRLPINLEQIDLRLEFIWNNPWVRNLLFWRAVRFTDECHVNKDIKATTWVIRLRKWNERNDPDNSQWKIPKGDVVIYIWAMVGYNFKSELVIYDIGKEGDHLNMKWYYDELFVPIVCREFEKASLANEPFILEEDNDTAHGTMYNTKMNDIERLRGSMDAYYNPPNAPDLSIIENCWRILKQRLKRRRFDTLEEFIRIAKVEWERIPQGLINKLVDSMPERIQQVWERKGNWSNW